MYSFVQLRKYKYNPYTIPTLSRDVAEIIPMTGNAENYGEITCRKEISEGGDWRQD
jgi:hypothetical protein